MCGGPSAFLRGSQQLNRAGQLHAGQQTYSSALTISHSNLRTVRLKYVMLDAQATREAIMVADAEDYVGQFSPLSPGCPNSTRRLQELFGLFRDDSLGRTNTEGPDELLSQVGDTPNCCNRVSATQQGSYKASAAFFTVAAQADSV
jgi:hypothetical protein